MAGKNGYDDSEGSRVIKVSEELDSTLEGTVSDDQLIILLDKFIASDKAGKWREQRLIAHKQWKNWIDPR